MSKIDQRIEVIEKRQAKLDKARKELLKNKAKDKKKYENRAIKVLGRIALSKLDASMLQEYFPAARKAEKKELLKCLPQSNPGLKEAIDKLLLKAKSSSDK